MIKVRSFTSADNPSLIALAQQLDVPARVKLGVDRSPDFTALSRVISGQWDILVAEENGNVIGFLEMNSLHFRVGESDVPALYIGLAGVKREKRGSAAFIMLMNAAVRFAYGTGKKLAVTLINENNRRLAKLLKLRYPWIIQGEKIVISCLFPRRRIRVDKRFRYQTASWEDFPEIIDLLRQHRKSYAVRPALDWDRIFSSPGLSSENILVAKDDESRIIAVLGLWDQRSFRQIKLVDLDLSTRLLQCTFRGLRPIIGISSIPEKGQNMRLIYVVGMAAEKDSESAFSGLIRYAMAKVVPQNYHFILLGIPEQDMCSSGVSGLLKITNVNIPIIFPFDDEIKKNLASLSPRIWLEYALT